jgi:hypothetical protein
MTGSYAIMDEALERLSGYGPDLRNGMTSHAPMVVEALCAMGRPQAALPWLQRYCSGILPRPAAGQPIPAAGWQQALRAPDRTSDWSAFFAEELRHDAWQTVLERWVDRLAPGISAAAAHGVIRTGHAVRSLTDAETPWRLRELADGLGYWAAHYQELPAAVGGQPGRLPPAEAIRLVPILPLPQRTFAGSIVSALAGLDGFPEFGGCIDLVDVEGDATSLLDALAQTFATVYLAQARDFLTSIVFVHSVTSVAALANIMPHLRASTARRAARFVWQVGCGLYATFADQVSTTIGDEPATADPEALIDAAVEHGDDHVIKFTETCLRFHARRPSPVYPAAIQRAMRLLPPPEN